MSETLYNGIVLPEVWPPTDQDLRCRQPMRVPYLEKAPELIPIDVGRQLFVDDFLLEECSMLRQFHPAEKYSGNPVFFPESEYELSPNLAPTTAPSRGGICYDEKDGLFKMWYLAGYLRHLAYAESKDGIHWERPKLDVIPGTNLVLPLSLKPDSGTVWLDRECQNPEQRFKMMFREGNDRQRGGFFPAELRTSPDGIHWSKPQSTGPMDDRSTCFYNPFRKKWVQSIRAYLPPRNRCRLYFEADDFYDSGKWKSGEPVFWIGADCYDKGETAPAELYNLDVTPYESLLIGLFQVLKGPPNQYGLKTGEPKLTEVYIGYSRDGFHWQRSDREAFIPASRKGGSWEYGYLESCGGVLLLVKDELWFYYSAFAGDPKRIGPSLAWEDNGMYSNAAVGLAKLRRDGFVSLRAGFDESFALTRKLLFTGEHLFVNVNTAGSLLRVECRTNEGVVPGFSAEECLGFRGNSTAAKISWKKQSSLKALTGQAVQFLFKMERGDLYSFWVSDSESGESKGYFGAGYKA